METIGQIFRGELWQLLHRPRALAAVLFIAVLACGCAWYALGVLWNPYQLTGEVPVAVVNEDAGARMSGKKLDMGAQLVESLQQDGRFDWREVDADEGRQGLESGAYYAEIVIPKDFSKSFAGVLQGEATRPAVQLWTNGKQSATSTGITDEGAQVVAAAVNQAFSEDLSDVVNQVAQGIASDMTASAGVAGSHAQSGLDTASLVITDISDSLLRGSDAINGWRNSVASARSSLEGLASSIPGLSQSVAGGSAQLASARSSAHALSAAYTGALAQGGTSVITSVRQVTERVREVSSRMSTAQGELTTAVSQARSALSSNERVIATLQSMIAEHPELESQIAELRAQNDELSAAVAALEEANTTVSSAATDAAQFADTTAQDVDRTITDIMAGDGTYNRDVMPALDTSMDSLASALGSLDSALAGLGGQVVAATSLMTQLDDVVTRTQVTLDHTVASLGTAGYNLLAARYDLSAIAGSGLSQELAGSPAGDAGYARVLTAPVSLNVNPLFAQGSNGSLAAPFYLCLALWALALMLVLAVGVPAAAQARVGAFWRRRYFARASLLFVIAAVAALVLCIGCLVMGVGAASLPALLLAAIVTVFAFVGIVYSMACSYGRIGVALAVAFLALQALVAANAQSTQLMPALLQGLMALLPFTYAADALAESVGGFSGLAYAADLLWLLACGAVALALGLVIRPRTPGFDEAPAELEGPRAFEELSAPDFEELLPQVDEQPIVDEGLVSS